MKSLIIFLLFINSPSNKLTLHNELVECEIIRLYSYSIDTLTYDTAEFNYLAKTEYCNLVLKFIKGQPDKLNFKLIKIGGKYKFHLKFLPKPTNLSNDENNPNIPFYFVTNLVYGGLDLHFNKDSLYELDYYYNNNFQEDSMAFNYMPLNVKGNFIHDSLIIYQP